MINEIKPLRENMREVVVTFEGEENFIVPKNDGFGQADNDKYVMVAGKSEVSDVPSSTPRPTTTTPPRSTTTTTPPRTTTTSTPPRTTSDSTPAPRSTTTTSTPPRNTNTFPSSTTPPRSTTSTPRPTSETTTPPRTTTTPPSSTTPPITTTPLPIIPNFNTLSKNDLHAQVLSLGRMKVQTTVYNADQIRVLTNAYNQALSLYNTKFGTTTPKDTPKPTDPSLTLPNLTTMSCEGLTAEIKRVETLINYNKFSTPKVADTYNKHLASAKSLFNSKCNRQPPPPPPNPNLPTFPNFATMSCDALKTEIARIKNVMATSRFGSTQITDAYNKALATANQVLLTKKCDAPTPPLPLPKFPNFATLSCEALRTEISKIQNTMATSRFGNSQIGDAYTKALATANQVLRSKCGGTPSPTPELPKEEKKEETPAPQGGGGGGAIGGGGGGGATEEPPAEEVPTEEVPQEEQKPNNSWLWILLVIGGIYLATRKKNKS